MAHVLAASVLPVRPGTVYQGLTYTMHVCAVLGNGALVLGQQRSVQAHTSPLDAANMMFRTRNWTLLARAKTLSSTYT